MSGGRLAGRKAHVGQCPLARGIAGFGHGRADGRPCVRGGAPSRHRPDRTSIDLDLAVEYRAGIAPESQPVGGSPFETLSGRSKAAVLQPGHGHRVRRDHAGPGPRLDRHVADRHPALHVQRADGLASVFNDVTRAAAEAEASDDGQGHILAADTGLQPPGHRHPHRLRLPLQQTLGRQNMADLGGAYAEGQRPEGPVRRRMAVAADDRHARLRQAQLRAYNVDDAAVLAVPAGQPDAVARAVGFQPLDLRARSPGDIRPLAIDTDGQGRGGVVQRGEGAVWPAYGQAAGLDLAEGLRAGHFMDQMQIDVEDTRRVDRLGCDHVPVPDLVEQGLRHVRPRGRRWPSRAQQWIPASRTDRAWTRRTGRGRPH